MYFSRESFVENRTAGNRRSPSKYSTRFASVSLATDVEKCQYTLDRPIPVAHTPIPLSVSREPIVQLHLPRVHQWIDERAVASVPPRVNTPFCARFSNFPRSQRTRQISEETFLDNTDHPLFSFPFLIPPFFLSPSHVFPLPPRETDSDLFYADALKFRGKTKRSRERERER